jgi:hypothetical protein
MASQPPAPNLDEGEELRATYAGAKRRIAALELQLENFLQAGSKGKSYVAGRFHPPALHFILSCCSDITTSITQGRVICRLVSMFENIDALVDESDRRRAIAADMVDDDETLESVEINHEISMLIILQPVSNISGI